MDAEAIVTAAAAVVACAAYVATWVSMRTEVAALKAELSTKVDNLRDEVEKHNHVIERVYDLEAAQRANEEKFKTIFNSMKEE